MVSAHYKTLNTGCTVYFGMQIAAGVPLQCDEGPEYRSFRLGLFGLDKLYDVDASVARLEQALDQVLAA